MAQAKAEVELKQRTNAQPIEQKPAMTDDEARALREELIAKHLGSRPEMQAQTAPIQPAHIPVSTASEVNYSSTLYTKIFGLARKVVKTTLYSAVTLGIAAGIAYGVCYYRHDFSIPKTNDFIKEKYDGVRNSGLIVKVLGR